MIKPEVESSPNNDKASPTQKDFVLVALLRAGGAEGFVDIEDIAVSAHRLAPAMFGWRRYPELPSAEATRIALRDAERTLGPLFLRGDAGRTRRFSAAGLKAAEAAQDRVGDGQEDGTLRRRPNRDLLRFEQHPAFRQWATSGISAVGRDDLADMLVCSPGSPAVVFQDRLNAAEAAAASWHRGELEAFLRDALSNLDSVLSRRGNE